MESIESSAAESNAALREEEPPVGAAEFCRSVPLRLMDEKEESSFGSSGKPPYIVCVLAESFFERPRPNRLNAFLSVEPPDLLGVAASCELLIVRSVEWRDVLDAPNSPIPAPGPLACPRADASGPLRLLMLRLAIEDCRLSPGAAGVGAGREVAVRALRG